MKTPSCGPCASSAAETDSVMNNPPAVLARCCSRVEGKGRGFHGCVGKASSATSQKQFLWAHRGCVISRAVRNDAAVTLLLYSVGRNSSTCHNNTSETISMVKISEKLFYCGFGWTRPLKKVQHCSLSLTSKSCVCLRPQLSGSVCAIPRAVAPMSRVSLGTWKTLTVRCPKTRRSLWVSLSCWPPRLRPTAWPTSSRARMRRVRQNLLQYLLIWFWQSPELSLQLCHINTSVA